MVSAYGCSFLISANSRYSACYAKLAISFTVLDVTITSGQLEMLVICQNPANHIFFAYSGVFKIAYTEIMPHMQKFTYIRMYATYFCICDRIFQHFFVQCLYMDKIEVGNVETMQDRPIYVNVYHDYDSSSLDVADARNMRRNMPHICGIYATYTGLAKKVSYCTFPYFC